MGKTFGILALIFGLVALLAGWAIALFLIPYGSWVNYGVAGLAILFGIIGIITDDSKAMAIVGMILGIIALIVWGFMWVFIAVIFAGFLGGLI